MLAHKHKLLLVIVILLNLTWALPSREPPRKRLKDCYEQQVRVIRHFKIDFECLNVTAEFCSYAARAVEKAANRISHEFKIKQRINVLCYIGPHIALAGTLPTAWIPVRHRDDNGTYMYPTGLLKQLDYPGVSQVSWPEHDFWILLSSEANWWFSDNQESKPIRRSQLDMETAVLHEMLHGMGFGISRVYGVVNHQNGNDYLLPFYRYHDQPQIEAVSNIKYTSADVQGFSYPSVWDRFTQIGGAPTPLIWNMTEACYQSVLNDVADNATTSLMAAKGQCLYIWAYQCATTANCLKFDSAAWPPNSQLKSELVLETGLRPFQPGASTSHAAFLGQIPEMLMYYKAFPGWSLDAIIRASGATLSGIGPRTRDAMLALGYSPAQGEWSSRSEYAFVEPSVLNKTINLMSFWDHMEFMKNFSRRAKQAQDEVPLHECVPQAGPSESQLLQLPSLPSGMPEKPFANARDELLYIAWNTSDATFASLSRELTSAFGSPPRM